MGRTTTVPALRTHFLLGDVVRNERLQRFNALSFTFVSFLRQYQTNFYSLIEKSPYKRNCFPLCAVLYPEEQTSPIALLFLDSGSPELSNFTCR